jgi:dTDP-4-amino-4,6-dideoxygalactose transaminase
MIICANPAAQFRSYQAEIEEAIHRVLEGGRYILGPELNNLEKEFADYIGTRHAVGVANGTDALELAIRALEIGPGDEVITVSHTAVATVAAIESSGAVPVLVDVDPQFYTINPEQLEQVVTPRTRAVIAVHLYGQPADLGMILAFCKKHELQLIEDVSQAHGSKWNGRRLGSVGSVACFSCYPTKNLGAIGDAGLVTTSDDNIAHRIRMLREYGWRERYVSDLRGRNSRLDEVQAAILRIKLRKLDQDNERRRQLAAYYINCLTNSGLVLPSTREGAEHVYHLFVVTTAKRQELIDHLVLNDIHAGIHYPVPVHLQPAYTARVATASSMKVTEKLAQEVLSLPIYPELTYEMADQVIAAIKSFQ